MDIYVFVALIAVSVLLTAAVSLPILKILQLSGYKARGVFSWWKATSYDTLIRYIELAILSVIAMVVYIGCFYRFSYARYCAPALYLVLAAVFVLTIKNHGGGEVKFTGRMIRLFALNAVLLAGVGVGVSFLAKLNVFCQTLTGALAMFAPFTALAANAVLAPIEKLNNKKYIKRAKAKLDEKKPTVIGITGSYGKTTAKNMLKAMLEREYTVLATPGSYNTPMGVCRTVNDMLGDEKFFIAELGARYSGDISELCGIVSPVIGVITAVGDMHIETLKSREGVANAKYELAEHLPSDGLLVLNGYNALCAELKARTAPCRVAVAGDDVSYKDIGICADGTSFTLVLSGNEYKVNMKLLGAHVAELAAVTAAVAIECGVSAENIVAALEAMPPVEHRLQLIQNGAVTVIDDAYNSNPVGASNALDVLSRFDAKKVIITPGFVELGAIEKESNYELGEKIAGVCDYAYLVGSRAADIKKGAVKSGMPEDRMREFLSRDDAVKALADIDGGKVVLFENDLPDNIK